MYIDDLNQCCDRIQTILHRIQILLESDLMSNTYKILFCIFCSFQIFTQKKFSLRKYKIFWIRLHIREAKKSQILWIRTRNPLLYFVLQRRAGSTGAEATRRKASGTKQFIILLLILSFSFFLSKQGRMVHRSEKCRIEVIKFFNKQRRHMKNSIL